MTGDLTPAPSSYASAEVEQAIARIFAAMRAGQLLFSALMVVSDRGQYRKPARQFAVLATMTAESAWLATRLLRRGAYQDRLAVWVDTLAASGALELSRSGLGDRSAPWMKNLAIGAAIGAASAEGPAESGLALAVVCGAAIATGVRGSGRDRHVAGAGLAVNDALSWAGMHAAARIYVVTHRKYAALRQAAEISALERATETAADAERGRQHRRLHAVTVGVLGQIAETTEIAVAEAMARREATRLRHALRSDGELPAGLDEALYEIAETLRKRGVGVELVTSELTSSLDPQRTAAVGDAVGLALLASSESSGAARAVVRARSEGAALRVSVRDHGRGFACGGGAAHEQRLERLRDVLGPIGGQVQWWSEPGRGTRVSFSLPWSAGSAAEGGLDQTLQRLPSLRVWSPPAGNDHTSLGNRHVERGVIRGLVGATQRQIRTLFRNHANGGFAGHALQASPQQGNLGLDPDTGGHTHHLSLAAGPDPVMGISTPFPTSGLGTVENSDPALQPDRVVVSAYLAWRLTGLATGAAALIAGWRRHRRPLIATIQLGGAVGESIWLARRLRRGEHWSDTPAGVADALAAVAALGTSRLTMTPEDGQTWLNWAPWSFAANVVAGQAMDVDSGLVGTAGAVAVTTVHAASGSGVAQVMAGGAGMGTFYVVGRIFARQIRDGAARLEEAQRAAVAARGRLAAERERLAQLRLLHDHALQTLETIGGGHRHDLGALRSAARAEAARLERALEVNRLAGERLDPELTRIAVEHRSAGLAVELELGPLEEFPASVVTALAGAVNEALTNVQKHAGVDAATVRARPAASGTGVVVTVEDGGRGFVLGDRSGFGTTESIFHRMTEAGGAATIVSTPDRGTLVTLEWPK